MTEQTFLFAVLSDLNAVASDLEDADAAQLGAECRRTACQVLDEHGAGEGKPVGEAIMACCPEAPAAIRAAVHVVDQLGEQHAFSTIRVGMNTGPASSTNGGWSGPAVGLAAQVASEAADGQVLLTDATRAAAGQLKDVTVVPRGRRMLRNSAEPVVLYEALLEVPEWEELPTDPVCEMAVDPHHAAGRLRHAGTNFYFCSLRCAHAFAADPKGFSPR